MDRRMSGDERLCGFVEWAPQAATTALRATTQQVAEELIVAWQVGP